ncbi:MAG: hypothetical protein HY834_01970 [Devosia nanyangense]|uniref:Uncharacterized protein n=1 Tax=Devosia nanyangense TaxID=1228055 RepID=A0A933KXL2_9HYPH|nr:hypothetical protein [Devosia nanyangense]
MPQLQLDASVPTGDQTRITAVAAKLFASVPDMQAYLDQGEHGYVCKFRNTVRVSMDHTAYPGARLERPYDAGGQHFDHFWQVPLVGGLTDGNRSFVYLAPASLYWKGIHGGGKKSVVERLIHEMVHASIPGIAGDRDPHKPEFYLAEKKWFAMLDLPFPAVEQIQLERSQHPLP